MRKFDKLVFTLDIFSLFLMVTLSSIVYDEIGVSGYGLAQDFVFVVTAIIVLIFILSIYLQMSYYTYKTVQILGDEVKKRSAELLLFSFIYMIVVSLSMMIGYIWFIETSYSGSFFEVGGAKIYVYPVLAGFGTINGFLALLYMFLFVINEYHSPITEKGYGLAILIFILFEILAILPYNFYALYPKGNINTRPIVVGFHLFFGLLVAIYGGYTLFRKSTIVYDHFQRNRMRIIALGFLIYPLVAVPPIIGLVLFPSIPMVLWYSIVYVVWLISSLLVYLGYLTPSWMEKRLR